MPKAAVATENAGGSMAGGAGGPSANALPGNSKAASAAAAGTRYAAGASSSIGQQQLQHGSPEAGWHGSSPEAGWRGSSADAASQDVARSVGGSSDSQPLHVDPPAVAYTRWVKVWVKVWVEVWNITDVMPYVSGFPQPLQMCACLLLTCSPVPA